MIFTSQLVIPIPVFLNIITEFPQSNLIININYFFDTSRILGMGPMSAILTYFFGFLTILSILLFFCFRKQSDLDKWILIFFQMFLSTLFFFYFNLNDILNIPVLNHGISNICLVYFLSIFFSIGLKFIQYRKQRRSNGTIK